MFNSDKLKEIRLDADLKQSDVAKMLGVSRSSYAMWESCNNIIPIKRLIEFCDIFKVSLDYVLGFSSENNLGKPSYDLKIYSQRLKEFREEYKLTQLQIANFLHVDQPTWSIYENGKSLIGTPFLYDICKKYKISADYILGKVDSPKYLK